MVRAFWGAKQQMDAPVKPNEVIRGNLRVEHLIGHGAYGQVWKLWHTQLDQPRAVKIIETSSLDPENLQRVKNECRIGGSLGAESGVVQVHDAFEQGEYLFLVMELMSEGNLARALKDKPHPFDVTLAWAMEMCDALSAVHAEGIVHRDIKPKNILLDEDGRVKISDFGIAHLPRSEITSYQPGTPGYRAPELESGGNVTPAADVFSLSAVLFEIWSGRAYGPYKAQDEGTVRKEFAVCFENEYPEVDDETHRQVIDLLISGLDPNPGKRISLEHLEQGLLTIKEKRNKPDQQITKERVRLAKEFSSRSRQTVISSFPQAPAAVRSAPPGKTAIEEWIMEDFGKWFAEDPNQEAIIWFDPRREWGSILPLLKEHIQLIVDEGSLLKVRYELETKDPEEQVVVYTPRSREEASYLRPFTFLSTIFSENPYRYLMDHDIPLPRLGDERQTLENYLPLLIEASVGRGSDFWQRIDSLESAEEYLIPNFRHKVFQFLSQPSSVFVDLERDGKLAIFLSMVQRRYGLSVEPRDPLEIAQKIFRLWILVDLFVRSDHSASFPRQNGLPHPMNFDECQTDIETYRNDARFVEPYLDLLSIFESENGDIVHWASQQEAFAKEPVLLSSAEKQWQEALELLATWQTRTDVLEGLDELRHEAEQGAKSYWYRLGIIEGWGTILQGIEVIEAARFAINEATGLQEASGFIQKYVDSWYEVDQKYRNFIDSPEASGSISNFRSWVNHFYDEYAEQTNIRWCETIVSARSWPPTKEAKSVSGLGDQIWSAKGRKAFFIVDALRFELAKELDHQLRGFKVNIDHRISELPSITPLGMSAFLPGASNRNVDWDDGLRILIDGKKLDLSTKGNRIDWLKQHLASFHSTSLADFLHADFSLEEEEENLVIFSDELDAWGEAASELAAGSFGGLLKKVAAGVRKAFDENFEIVHMVTDHGFLLLGQVEEPQKIELKKEQNLKVSHRYALGFDLPETEGLLRFPVKRSSNLVGLYPPGVACFKAGGRYNFAHGGASLQEIIIPYIQVERDVSYTPVDVELLVEDQIFSGIFKVSLQPKAASMFPSEREVVLTVKSLDGETLERFEELVSPGEGVTKNVRLTPSMGLGHGDVIEITMHDSHSGEQIGEPKTVEIHVDLGL